MEHGGIVFSYAAYGLNISSALVLPELVPSKEGEVDITVSFGKVEGVRPGSDDAGCIQASAQVAYLFWKVAGLFEVRYGREIIVDPAPGVDERIIRQVVLGPGLGALLFQRGWLPLHASSVRVEDGAVAFIGEQGCGKSTMAAAMCARGHHLVADDVTAIRANGFDRPTVHPGYPQLKLWPDAAASLGEDPDTLPLLVPMEQKRAQRTVRGFSMEPVPLRHVYVLASGEMLGIKPMGPQQALVEMVRHTYGRRLLRAAEIGSHFFQCTNVLSTVPVSKLERPRSFAMLLDVARLVEENSAHTVHAG